MGPHLLRARAPRTRQIGGDRSSIESLTADLSQLGIDRSVHTRITTSAGITTSAAGGFQSEQWPHIVQKNPLRANRRNSIPALTTTSITSITTIRLAGTTMGLSHNTRTTTPLLRMAMRKKSTFTSNTLSWTKRKKQCVAADRPRWHYLKPNLIPILSHKLKVRLAINLQHNLNLDPNAHVNFHEVQNRLGRRIPAIERYLVYARASTRSGVKGNDAYEAGM
ncbi:hypothetical protein QBC35DRAFT_448487 [Podospora australis]|uniref:Uncharacterized protein n=1 Tax=Podospora australis TaxID=1536484 RepID=A0AAN6X0V6_9PEZI|nr:hypothetical protein QBC35DRAFT_448487 [Podospora australis]